MAKRTKTHQASDYCLDVLSGDDDLFQWFLLCYLFGKPIRSGAAVTTWEIFIERELDNPWAIAQATDGKLVNALRMGGYSRYQHVTSDGLKKCMKQLIDRYEGSLMLMLESSNDEDEFSTRLQKLHGVGPKITEIFMTEVVEFFARRVE